MHKKKFDERFDFTGECIYLIGKRVLVFIETNRFKDNKSFSANSIVAKILCTEKEGITLRQ